MRRLVPAGLIDNLRVRRALLLACKNDRLLQAAVRRLCAEDAVFFLGLFAWVYEPRPPDRYSQWRPHPHIPFIPWDFQIEVIDAINAAIDSGHDLVIEKSRDMGATWTTMLTILWRFLFCGGETFMVVSRKEDLVDGAGNVDTLLGKVDYTLDRLPGFLKPPIRRRHMHVGNEQTGATITGETTTGNVGRGGRRTAIMLDEFASFDDDWNALSSTRDATNCRIFNSTPKGSTNAFATKAHDGTPKVTLHWSRHPWKNQGLYRDEKGRLRSPWYDEQCRRAGSPAEIARELDIDYFGSDAAFFESALIDEAVGRCRDPVFRADVRADFPQAPWRRPVLEPSPHGMLRTWIMPKAGEFERSHYGAGIDVATGVSASGDVLAGGSSNSCISVVDLRARRKVAELAVSNMTPDVFADLCMAVCGLFLTESGEPPMMIWEANGPGAIFGRRILSAGYPRFWVRRAETQLDRPMTTSPGWWSDRAAKAELLGMYQRALRARLFENPSREAIEELRSYKITESGQIVHSASIRPADPTASREMHGDRVIADALACKLLWEYHGWTEPGEAPEKRTDELVAPPGSMAYRILKARSRLWERGLEEDPWNYELLTSGPPHSVFS